VSHILWLASFPKSGNTWLRAFLANYLTDAPQPVPVNALTEFALGDMRAEPYTQLAGRPAAELPWREINTLRPQVHRHLAGRHDGIVFVKTHAVLGSIEGVPTITPDVTFGAVYVVRNPLDVAVSFADHYGLSVENGARAVCFDGLRIEPKEGHVPQLVTDWTTHVQSWRKAPGLYLHLLRFEDMLASPQSTFGKLLDFLKVKKDRDRLMRAIRHSSFRVLAEQERTGGFVERSRNAERFFRSGKAGGWREALTPAQADMIIAAHRPLMQELDYLDAEGKVLP
jgi:Sulfotransferase domain.